MAVFKRLISPVFGKEMTQFAASRRNFVLKCVFLALTFAIIALTAVSAEFQTGKFLCSAASIIGLVTAFFAVPIMTAGIVSAEVEANTLHLLFLTNLTPWNIAQDKALSRVAQMSYLLTLLLPIYACGMLFGGITWLQVLAAMGYLLGTVLLAAGCGILCGTMGRTYSAALLGTYVTIPAVMLAISVICGNTGMDIETVLLRFNPFMIVVIFTDVGSASRLWDWPWYMGFGCLIYLAGTALAAYKTKRMRNMAGSRVKVRRRSSPFVQLKRFHLSIICPPQAAANPIAWRDGYAAPLPFLWTVRHLLLFAVAIVPIGIWILRGDGIGRDMMVGLFAGSTLAAVSFLGSVSLVIYGSMAMVHERSQKTLPILLSTALSSRDIAYGYLRNGLRMALEVTLAELVCMASLGVATDDDSGATFFTTSAALLVGAVVVIAVLAWQRSSKPDKPLHHLAEICYWTFVIAIAVTAFALSYGTDSGVSVWGMVALLLVNYFYLISSLWISMKRKNLKGALGSALLLVLGVHMVPGLLAVLMESETMAALTPSSLVVVAHMMEADASAEVVTAAILGFAVYGLTTFGLTTTLPSRFEAATERAG